MPKLDGNYLKLEFAAGRVELGGKRTETSNTVLILKKKINKMSALYLFENTMFNYDFTN